MSAFIVDASVAVKWFVSESGEEAARRLIGQGRVLHAPDLLLSEVGNVLWKKVRRAQYSAEGARTSTRALLLLPIRIHAGRSLVEGALDLALRTGCTVYDGMYVSLAIGLAVPLVTADQRLLTILDPTPLRRQVVRLEEVE